MYCDHRMCGDRVTGGDGLAAMVKYIYLSGMLWLNLAYVVPSKVPAEICFLIALCHGVALLAAPWLHWFALDDKEYRGL